MKENRLVIEKLGIILVLLCTCIFSLIGCQDRTQPSQRHQQKVIFTVHSIKIYPAIYNSDCQKACSPISDSIDNYLNSGWHVVSSSPKEQVVDVPPYTTTACQCVGTEYIIEK